METDELQFNEVVDAAARVGLPLGDTLQLMLGEHYSHRTERRGCGYTQATRLFAEHINLAPSLMNDSALFARPLPSDWALRLAALGAAVALPESRLVTGLLQAILLRTADVNLPDLGPVAPEKLKVGSCPLAEQYFLEIAHHFVRRRGRVNVVVDAHGAPLLIEKRGLGDDHSCISVAPVRMNGVQLPIGSLLAVSYDDADLASLAETASRRGNKLPLSTVKQWRLLRLTTLVVAPTDRPRAFSAHFQQQISGGLFSPDTTRIEDLVAVAQHEAN